MTTTAQRSFAGGELTPALYARVDTEKYGAGARKLWNYQVMRNGGAQSRPGTEFVAFTKNASSAVRLIPFVFNQTDAYVLEFGEQYVRFHKQGAQLVTEIVGTLPGFTAANPLVASYSGADQFANGDELFFENYKSVGRTFMDRLNGRNFRVTNVDTVANTFNLTYLDGTTVDSSTWGTPPSTGGQVYKVVEVATPYAAADLAALSFVQSGDVLFLAHPNYAPQELLRLSDTSWVLSATRFAPLTPEPSAITVTAGGAGAVTRKYRVTAVSESGEESLLGTSVTTSTIAGITQAAPPVVTTSGVHSFFNGDEVVLSGIAGMTELNSRRFTVTRISTTTFSLNDIDATTFAAYVSGGTVTGTARTVTGAAPVAGAPNVVSWTAALPGPGGAVSYYKIYSATENDGSFGLVGVSTGTSYSDVGATPDMLQPPPLLRNVFDRTGRYPSAVAFFQQRLVYANTNSAPETVYASRIGAFRDFRATAPTQANDAITFTLAGQQVNRVKHMMEMGALALFTLGAEHTVGERKVAFTPFAINPNEESGYGCSNVRPLKVGNVALFVQALGNMVRSLGYEFSTDGYRGNELSIFASHLFEKETIVDWAYQQVPHSIAWAVRSDGILLGFTFVPEQQIIAWHRHGTDGVFENVCAIPESTQHYVYACVRRTVNGQTVRTIERFGERVIRDVKTLKLMDSSLAFDGRNTSAVTFTLSGGTLWNSDETLTLTASANTFEQANIPTEVGNEYWLTFEDAPPLRFTVTGYTSQTVVTGRVDRDVPVSRRGVATTAWARTRRTLAGLWHLEGKTISVYGDGFVVASPNNTQVDTVVTVSDGKAVLPAAYSTLSVGLPFTADLQTLDLDTAQGETLTDKKTLIGIVNVRVRDTRGLFAGSDEPTGTDSLARLYEFKLRNNEGYHEPTELLTGTGQVVIDPSWDSNGRVFLRQVDPLPAEILAVYPNGRIPTRG